MPLTVSSGLSCNYSNSFIIVTRRWIREVKIEQEGYISVTMMTAFFFSKASWKYRILSWSSLASRFISLSADALRLARAEINLAAYSVLPTFRTTRFT